MRDPVRNWFFSAVTVGIAAQLLDAEEPLTSEALAIALDRPKRTMRELLARLHRGQLVARVRIESGEPGRPAWGYWLNDQQIPGAQRAVDTPPALWESQHADAAASESEDVEVREAAVVEVPADPTPEPHTPQPVESRFPAPEEQCGRLVRGQELVLVHVEGTALSDLLEALSATRTADDAAWVSRIGDDVAFAFHRGSEAVDLLAVLGGARFRARVAFVGDVVPIETFVEQARRMAPQIRRARSERDAHDATH